VEGVVYEKQREEEVKQRYYALAYSDHNQIRAYPAGTFWSRHLRHWRFQTATTESSDLLMRVPDTLLPLLKIRPYVQELDTYD
jgi:hypothetical protein